MRYIADKSMDAEILIDLEKGVINLDYFLNKFQVDDLNSNESDFAFQGFDEYDKKVDKVLISPSEYLKLKLMRLKKKLYFLLMRNQNFRTKLQYKNQQLEEDLIRQFYGISEYKFTGRQKTNELIYHLTNNIWFEYELEGDYKNIKAIELKRRMIKNIFKGETFDAQDGWDLRFYFGTIPMNGSCTIRYL